MKNVVRLENYYSPSELENAIAAFVEYYNNARYHEALENQRRSWIDEKISKGELWSSVAGIMRDRRGYILQGR